MNTVLITGANRGIGLELCRQLAERGDEVIATCRQASRNLRALNVRLIEGIDVLSAQSLDCLKTELHDQPLDWLINNAGVLSVESLDALDFDAIERQFRVNALGPIRVSAALLPNLGRGAKIGIVTSRMGSIEDNTSGGYYGYRMSKAALNIAGVSMARDLKDKSIMVALLHPGLVSTEMSGHRGVSPAHAVRGLIRRMDELTMATSGGFWHAEGDRLPW